MQYTNINIYFVLSVHSHLKVSIICVHLQSEKNPLLSQRPSLLSLRPVSVWTSHLTFKSCLRSPSSGECVSLD